MTNESSTGIQKRLHLLCTNQKKFLSDSTSECDATRTRCTSQPRATVLVEHVVDPHISTPYRQSFTCVLFCFSSCQYFAAYGCVYLSALFLAHRSPTNTTATHDSESSTYVKPSLGKLISSHFSLGEVFHSFGRSAQLRTVLIDD